MTINKALLWDTFKAYIRGAFINQKAYLNRQKRVITEKILGGMARLEARHKLIKSKKTKLDLDTKVNELKLMGASVIA